VRGSGEVSTRSTLRSTIVTCSKWLPNRSSGRQAADSSAYHNLMLTYGGESYHSVISRASSSAKQRSPRKRSALRTHKLVSDPLAEAHAFDGHRVRGPNYGIISNLEKRVTAVMRRKAADREASSITTHRDLLRIEGPALIAAPAGRP
jgi:hypothetical protein